MEPHSYHQHLQNPGQAAHDQESSGASSGVKSSFFCRQSTTRWIPTTDQIRILKDLYYNNGVRSPNAEQIQRISAKLRQYGKIEGKNVFYWFQNHKARERQKKRFTVDITSQNKYISNVNYAGFSTPTSATSPPSFLGFAPAGSVGCGASYLEKKGMIRDYNSIPGAIGGGNYNAVNNSFNWSTGATGRHQGGPATFIPLIEADQKAFFGSKGDIETLQLFPMHDHQQEDCQEEENCGHGTGFCDMGTAHNPITASSTSTIAAGVGENYIHGWFLGDQPIPTFSATTLELSLGSPAFFSGSGHRT